VPPARGPTAARGHVCSEGYATAGASPDAAAGCRRWMRAPAAGASCGRAHPAVSADRLIRPHRPADQPDPAAKSRSADTAAATAPSPATATTTTTTTNAIATSAAAADDFVRFTIVLVLFYYKKCLRFCAFESCLNA